MARACTVAPTDEVEAELIPFVVDAVPAALAFVDADGRFRFVNAYYESFYGLERQAILGRRVAEIVGEETFACRLKSHADRALAGERVSFRTEIPRARLGPRQVEVTYVPRSRDGRVVGYAIFAVDITARVELERQAAAERAAAEAQREILGLVTDALPVGLSYVDCEGRYRYVNQRYEDWLARPKEGILGGTIRHLLGERVWRDIEPNFRRALAGEHVFYELNLIRHDAGERRHMVHYAPHFDEEGAVQGVVILSIDIEAQRRLEERLDQARAEAEERERMLRQLIDAVPAAIAFVDPTEHVRIANREFLDRFGAETDPEAPRLEEVFGTAAAAAMRPQLSRALGGETLHAERQLRTRRGETCWVDLRCTPFRDGDARIRGMLMLFVDITAAKAFDAELRHRERWHRDLVETLPEIVWEIDAAFRWTYLSPRFEEVLGVPVGEMLGRPFTALTDDAEAKRLHAAFTEAAAGLRPLSLAGLRRTAKSGEERILECRAAPVLDNRGRLTGYRGVEIDITVQRAAQSEARAARERSRQLERDLEVAARVGAVGALTSSIAHELSQPLGALAADLARIRLLLEKGDAAAAETALVDAAAQSERAAETVRGLRRAFGGGGPELRPFDLEATINEALELVFTGEQRDVPRRLRLEPELPPALIDRRQIQQVVVNLVQNALEAATAAGQAEAGIELAVERRPDGRLSVAVLDRGPGVPAALRDALFQPYRRGGSGNGLGLGLFISQRIVEAHGGRLGFSDRPGGGTIFSFDLGAAAGSAE